MSTPNLPLNDATPFGRLPQMHPATQQDSSPLYDDDQSLAYLVVPQFPSPQDNQTPLRKRKVEHLDVSQPSTADEPNDALPTPPDPSLSHLLFPHHPHNQTSLRKREKVASHPEPEETPNLSSTSLTDNSANKLYELSSLMWLLRTVYYWKELEKQLSKNGYLLKFYESIISYINEDLLIKESPRTSLDKHISGMLSKLTKSHQAAPLFLTTHRNEEKWSPLEKDFLRIMVFDLESPGTMEELKKGTLSQVVITKIAITLGRSMENCLSEWHKLIQQTHSSSEETIQPSPETAPNRLAAKKSQLNELEIAMVALWIEKLEQINPGQDLWIYCNEIAKSFYKEPSFKKDPSNPFKLENELHSILSQAQKKNEVASLSRDRSEKCWHFIEKKFLKFMLSHREKAKENLRIALAILGRAPVDVDLTPEYLKALQGQIQASGQVYDLKLLKLNTILCGLLDSENLKDDDDNPLNFQSSTTCSSIVPLHYPQRTPPTRPSGLLSQTFMQEIVEEGIGYDQEMVHRGPTSYPPTLPNQEIDPKNPVDLNLRDSMRSPPLTALPFDALDDELLLLSPPHSPTTQAPLSLNKEIPARRFSSPPDPLGDTFEWMAPEKEPPITEFTEDIEKEEAMWKEIIWYLLASGLWPS